MRDHRSYSAIRRTLHLTPRWSRAIVIIVMLLAILAVVRITGGTIHVWPHLYYAPIILAAYWYPLPVVLIVAVTAGLMMGPLMPLTEDPEYVAQPAVYWLVRLAFFLSIGALTSLLFQTMRGAAEHARRQGELARDLALTLDKTCEQILRSLMHAVDSRDPYTRYHSDRVARYSVALGLQMGLDDDQVTSLGWAGLCHDLGKISVPRSVLGKPGPLTARERETVEQHPVISTRIVGAIDDLEDTVPAVKHHHERYDGSGYPDSLVGDEIPLSARILAVADVFAALTEDRPYRKQWQKQRAINHIIEGSGTLFCPQVVEAFTEICESLPTYKKDPLVPQLTLMPVAVNREHEEDYVRFLDQQSDTPERKANY